MLETVNIEAILNRALAAGGEFAEIYFEEGHATQIVAEDGRIEKVLSSTDRGASIRVISDFRTAFGYTNDVTEKSLLELAATVSNGVKGRLFDREVIISPLRTGIRVPCCPSPGEHPAGGEGRPCSCCREGCATGCPICPPGNGSLP